MYYIEHTYSGLLMRVNVGTSSEKGHTWPVRVGIDWTADEQAYTRWCVKEAAQAAARAYIWQTGDAGVSVVSDED